MQVTRKKSHSHIELVIRSAIKYKCLYLNRNFIETLYTTTFLQHFQQFHLIIIILADMIRVIC